MLEHVGPWTEQDYLALPADRRRIELLDGSLLVSPSAGYRHQRLSFQLCYALAVAAPPGFEMLEAINVRVAPGSNPDPGSGGGEHAWCGSYGR
jgi:Uma2 family endonuclease